MNLSPLPVLINALASVEDSFDRKSGCVTHTKSAIRKIKFFRPSRQSHRLPVERQNNIVGSIVHLRITSGPCAIFRTVVAIIVHALNLMPIWRKSHIFKECLERGPALADLDPASAVVGEAFDVRIAASIDHCSPAPVNRAVAHSMRSASFSDRSPASEASTGFCIARSKICRPSNRDISAVALTPPSGRRFAQTSNSNKIPKSMSTDIYGFHAVTIQELACNG